MVEGGSRNGGKGGQGRDGKGHGDDGVPFTPLPYCYAVISANDSSPIMSFPPFYFVMTVLLLHH